MKLLKNWREQSRHKRAEETRREAIRLITLLEFAGGVYVAYDGNPLLTLSEKTTMAEAVEKLNEIRANYFAAKQSDLCTSRNG